MKRYLLYFVILLVFISGIAIAQAPRTNNSLIFSLTKDFTYSGLCKGIGYKHYDGSVAYRASVGGEYNVSESDTAKNLTVSLSVLPTIAETKRTSVYAGGSFVYDYREYTSQYTRAIYGVYAIEAILGGEIFILDNFSLGAENAIIYLYNPVYDYSRLVVGNFNYRSEFFINIYF